MRGKLSLMDVSSGSPDQERKIIYDFGANNGDDISYYLKKADLVVAIEANPSLCRGIEERFSAAIAEDRLRVENCAVVAEEDAPQVAFYLHRRHHVLGQLPRPDEAVIGDYETVQLPSRSVMQILRKHGPAWYIKTDMEGYDHILLRKMFENGIRPAYISAESTTIQVFALMVALGEYKAFKLVEGQTVAEKYADHAITVAGGRERYSFPPHSAGPFGDDIAGEWMNADDLFRLLAERGMGWRDIHATSTVEADPTPRVEKVRMMRRHFRGWFAAKLRSR